MATSTVEGTIESIKVRRKVRNVTIFDAVTIRQADGHTTTLNKMVVAAAVADLLQPGTAGRFYTFAAFHIKGIHGVRTVDGRSAQAFPANNETIMAVVGLINVAIVIGWLVFDNAIAFIPLALVLLGAVGYVFYRGGRIDAARQFAADSGYVPAARLSSAPA